MSKRPVIVPVLAQRFDWKTSLAKLAVGEKLLVHEITQARAGNAVASHNTNGKRYVTKNASNGIQIIRIL